jgi:lipopolysaccharide/colanic/teichoic acid biosynthesis glycosyltransferase
MTNILDLIFGGCMLKRCIDLILAGILIILLLPIIILVCLFVRLLLGSPVIFRQERSGLNSIPFELYKFRTMTDACNSNGALLSDDLRVTNFGRFLRQASLDELPQLLNVLRGDISFVGPRPLLMRYLPLYTPEESRRHEVRPGITG